MTGEQVRRGAHVLRAVVDLIAERGLEAATMRNVAASAGISLAQVQYYFRSKEELVAAAFQHVSELFDLKLATIDLSAPPRLLDAAAAEGDLAEVTDTETEAALLLAVLDGLVVQALAMPEPDRPPFLTESLDAHLTRLFSA